MANLAKILGLILRDQLLPRDLLDREPEPSAEMVDPNSIAGFDEAGRNYLLPLYHFCARAVSALAPEGGHVLDLGCGSGQFALYLSRYRPDLTITGIDVSEEMLNKGRENAVKAGRDGRVLMERGDMCDLDAYKGGGIDLVCSVFSLHHLRSVHDLTRCLTEISALTSSGASLWIFDHARPRRQRTTIEFPRVFTPDADRAFCEDSSNSVRAAWSFDELGAALRAAGLRQIRSDRARLLPYYQIHWVANAPRAHTPASAFAEALAQPARREARQFEALFRVTPQRCPD